MTAFIRSLCLAALLAAGSAWAQQQQTDNPDNPHSTKAKDKTGSSTSTTDTNQQTQQAETANPHSTQYTPPAGSASKSSIDAAERQNPDNPASKDRTGTSATADQRGMAMDHDQEMTMLKNATPEMQLQKLHKVNLHEIDAAKLAEQNGTDRVKTFARTLVRDHQDADKKVMDLAKKKNVSLSDAPMNPDKQKEKEMKKDRLSSLKGTEFDREFANQMAKGHQKVISLAQAWTQNCKDKDVCDLINSMLPTLQRHEQMAERLSAPAAQGRTPEPNR
jgi:putative membrane protein